MTGGTVCCFLCKATVFYQKVSLYEIFFQKCQKTTQDSFSVQDDRLQLQDHLRSEHETEDEEGLEYLIAGCLMNSEERQAIVNVVKVGRAPFFWFLLKKYPINRILGSGAR